MKMEKIFLVIVLHTAWFQEGKKHISISISIYSPRFCVFCFALCKKCAVLSSSLDRQVHWLSILSNPKR